MRKNSIRHILADDQMNEMLAELVKELNGAPSIILFDGKPYKVIPTELADRIVNEAKSDGH